MQRSIRGATKVDTGSLDCSSYADIALLSTFGNLVWRITHSIPCLRLVIKSLNVIGPFLESYIGIMEKKTETSIE